MKRVGFIGTGLMGQPMARHIVITMVTDSKASEEVICGKNGVLDGVHPGLILIDMGSIAPEVSRSIAIRAKGKGVPMLDAPVTGNPKVASEASTFHEHRTCLKRAQRPSFFRASFSLGSSPSTML